VNPLLRQLFNKIENQRKQVLTLVSSLSNEQLLASPAPGKWSVSQIISHLIMTERLSVNYMKKKIQGIEQTADSGLLEESKMVLLKISQRLPGLKFRAPKYVQENTVLYDNLETLKMEWDKTRAEFQEFLEKIEDRHLDRKIYKHVAVGYLNVKHAVQFFGEHVTHHTPQIKKLVKKV
jgi:uncharacterized damage-inducible protein DinB